MTDQSMKYNLDFVNCPNLVIQQYIQANNPIAR